MKKFLTLKHWQVFGILLGLPMVFQIIVMGSIISSKAHVAMMYVIPVMILIGTGLFFIWFYALGTNLHKKLPVTATMNLTKFKIFLFVPVAYMFFLSVFMFGVPSDISIGLQPDPAIFAIIVPLHLFSMFCIFYCLYFNAKALKTVEWQKPVTFSDCSGEFFLMWFFPIGIWMIQPRINKLFDTNINNDNIKVLSNNIL